MSEITLMDLLHKAYPARTQPGRAGPHGAGLYWDILETGLPVS